MHFKIGSRNDPTTPVKTKMKTTLVKLTGACVLAFAMASGVQAQILANDPFLTGGGNYTTSGSVVGQNPTVTGFTGGWFNDFQGDRDSVSATPISYSGTTGYDTTPGSGALVNVSQDGRAGRTLASSVLNALTASSGTVYISFLMQLPTVGGYQAVELGDGSDGDRFLQVGASTFGDFQNSTDFGITLNASGGGGVSGVFGSADTNPHLFVLQLNLTSGTDTLNAWEDPTNVTGGVVTGGTEVSLSGFTVAKIPSNFLLGTFGGGSQGTEVSDIRFGLTLADVTASSTNGAPVPNPPSISPGGGIVAGTNVTLTEILIPQVSNPPYTYQWLSNSVSVGTSVTSNSSTNVLSINTTGFAVGSYNYQVVVSNSVGSATSAPVVLNIVTLMPLPGTSLVPTVWWAANATNNIVNNGMVTQLTDQSGHENNAVQDTQNGTPLPLMVSNAVNGLPTLNFGGTNSLISPTGATTGNSSHSIFIVASYTAISGQFRNGAVFYSDTAGVDQNSCIGVDPDSNNMWVGGYGQDNSPYVGNISLNGSGFNILGKIYTASSANYQGFVAGVLDVNASGDTYNLGDTRVGLGKQYNNGSYWSGDIAEVIVFNSALSYSDLEAVQHYLANKYNLALALPPIFVTSSMPYASVGSNVAVTVTLPVLTTTTTVTITSDNPSITGFSSTNLTFNFGDTNVQTFNVNILAVGTANLTASSSSYNNGILSIGGLPPATLIEDYHASSLTNLNGGAAVNNGDPISSWAGDINNNWIWQPNFGADPIFQAQGTPVLTPAIDFQGNGSLDVFGGTSGLVAGRSNFSVALVFKADAAGVGASGGQWGSQTGIIDDTPAGSGGGNDFGISISASGDISAGLGGVSTTTICKTNYNLVTSTYHVAVASYDTLNRQMSLTVDDQPTVISSSPISSGTMADNDIILGGSSYEASSRYFSGAIAEVRFYDGALTFAQATNLIYTLKTNYSILYPSEEFVTLTPANATLFDGSNAVLTLTIPQAVNANSAVTVTVTNNNPGVVSLQGAVGNVLTVTFPAGATNVQSVIVTGVGGGQASLTYASPGLVTPGPATINVLVGISLSQITGGDSGEGFAPLPVAVGGVDFGSSTVTIQGVTFTNGGFTGENGIITGTFSVPQSFGFGSTPNDSGMATMLSHSTFAYTQGTQYSVLTSGDQYDQYQFTGLTAGKTYQVDIFTVCDAAPRPTLTQVVGATTNAYVVETGVTPQDVVYDMAPDANGNITVEWSFGSGPYNPNGNGNSGCVSGMALTTQASTAPTLGVARSGSSLVLTWSAGSTLLQATNLTGPWTTNVNTSPYTNVPTGPQMFFKVQAP